MGNSYSEKVKSMLDEVYGVADCLDLSGVSKQIPFIDPDEGMRGTIRTDILLLIFRIIDCDTPISEDCLSYLNDCVGVSFNHRTAEIARKKTVEADIPQLCVLLPSFIVIDRRIGGNGLSTAYIQALAYVALGYLKCQEHVSLKDMMNYYRYISGCIELVEKTSGEKVDFDPLENISESQKDLIKCALEADRLLNKREKDPVIVSMEEALVKKFSDKGDTGMKEDDICEIIKEEGDGSDLPGEVQEITDTELMPTAMEELDKLIGLDDVKHQIKSTLNVYRINSRCKELGLKRSGIGLHMVFTGNPGTGKTTVARILGKIYHEVGLLSKGHFVEATRGELVGKYVGHTAAMVKEVFEKAKGGVLFIDEAYSLTAEGDSFGEEAINTLLKLMEDNRDEIAVIVAGYPVLMQDFLEANPGLRSRFPFVVNFPDYSGGELFQIFNSLCNDNDISPDYNVIAAVRAHFNKEAGRKVRNGGNARAVRNYFEKMLINQADRLIKDRTTGKNDLCRFVMEDIPRDRILSDNSMRLRSSIM